MAYILKGLQTAVKTANYTAAFGETVRCNPTGGAFQITLPDGAASADNDGRWLRVKNQSASTNNITVVGQSSATIDGAANKVMSTARQCLRFEYNYTDNDWVITDAYP